MWVISIRRVRWTWLLGISKKRSFLPATTKRMLLAHSNSTLEVRVPVRKYKKNLRMRSIAEVTGRAPLEGLLLWVEESLQRPFNKWKVECEEVEMEICASWE